MTVVARDFDEGFDDASTWSGPRSMKGPAWTMDQRAELVVAATDDQALNDRIAEAAAVREVYCNRADGLSTFLIPSVVERENFKVAVSTEGRSPGMSKYIRLELDRVLPPRYDRMIELQEELREEAKRSLPSQRVREERLWEVLGDQQVWEAAGDRPGRGQEAGPRKVGEIMDSIISAHITHKQAAMADIENGWRCWIPRVSQGRAGPSPRSGSAWP